MSRPNSSRSSLIGAAVLAIGLLFSSCAGDSPQLVLPAGGPELSVIPAPVKMERQQGQFVLNSTTVIDAGRDIHPTVELCADALRKVTGLPLPVVENKSVSENVIRLKVNGGLLFNGEESYILRSSSRQVIIEAFDKPGFFYAFQTLRQLLPQQAFKQKLTKARWAIPAVLIEDHPRFAWRGMMLDSARYFQPVEDVKRFIDMLAMMKMNRMHWHLTDDQGWRVEIKKYPGLTDVASRRKESILGHYYRKPRQYDGQEHGGYYTQQEISEIVRYAQQRFITIVPEIETVGHSTGVIAAYPEIGVINTPLEVSTVWGVHKNLMNAEDSTIEFVKDILDEVMDLFPSKYIHIGGDEAKKDQWIASPDIQKRIKQLGLADENELQSWFIGELVDHLEENGRMLMGWDEILDGGLAEGALVMAWRGDDKIIEGVEAGAKVISAPTHSTYLDYYQAHDSFEPVAIGGFLPLEKVYSWKPVPEMLQGSDRKAVLGGQVQLWTEYLPDMKAVEYAALPRGFAAAEVLWSREDRLDFQDFLGRMIAMQKRVLYSGYSARMIGEPEVRGLVKVPSTGSSFESLMENPEELPQSLQVVQVDIPESLLNAEVLQLRLKLKGVQVKGDPSSGVRFSSPLSVPFCRVRHAALTAGESIAAELFPGTLLTDFSSRNQLTFLVPEGFTPRQITLQMQTASAADLEYEIKGF